MRKMCGESGPGHGEVLTVHINMFFIKKTLFTQTAPYIFIFRNIINHLTLVMKKEGGSLCIIIVIIFHM